MVNKPDIYAGEKSDARTVPMNDPNNGTASKPVPAEDRVSNWSAWQTQRVVDLQERYNWSRLQLIQPMYSLVKRQAEVELLPTAQANGIGVIPHSPTAAGVLSGKYSG